MQLSAPIRRHQAVALALASFMAVSPAAIAQTAGQKPAGQAKPAPAAPAAKPAPAPGTQKPAAAAAKPAEAPPGKGTADRYTATAVALGGVTGETITVDLIRWSTDAERDKAVAMFKDKGDKDLQTLLQAAPNLGYIWRSGSGFGSFVRYATKWKGADGEHVALITDSDLSVWLQSPGAAPAKPAAAGAPAAPAAKYPFTVIEIVAPAVGLSTGKMSLSSKVISDAEAKSIRIEDFKGAPTALRSVRHMKGGS